jgi:DNA-binding transcriptional regulator GbsR (MarR family)
LPRADGLDLEARSTDISVMTEISVPHNRTACPLHPAIERFVLHWGEMGGQWGVNRSVGQVHALLYVSERPLTADEIAATLGIARSNVSNSLKELLGWELIRRVPIRGDRREHFEAETDVWNMVRRISTGRKAREIDPALAALRACVAEAEGDRTVPPVAAKRLEDMLAFTEAVDAWYTQMLSVPKGKLAAIIRLGAKIIRFIPSGKRG